MSGRTSAMSGRTSLDELVLCLDVAKEEKVLEKEASSATGKFVMTTSMVS